MGGKARAGGWGVGSRVTYSPEQCISAQLVLSTRRGSPAALVGATSARWGLGRPFSIRRCAFVDCAGLRGPAFLLASLLGLVSGGVGRFGGGMRDGRWVVCVGSSRGLCFEILCGLWFFLLFFSFDECILSSFVYFV